MQLGDFRINIPSESIAQTPLKDRASSRLMHLEYDSIHDQAFSDLPQMLRNDDLLILNNTKVLPARLLGKKKSGGKVEIFFERLLTDLSFLAQLKFSGKIHLGTEIIISEEVILKIESRENQFFTISAESPVMKMLNLNGLTPLPPYIKGLQIQMIEKDIKPYLQRKRALSQRPQQDSILRQICLMRSEIMELRLVSLLCMLVPVHSRH